MQAPVTNNFRYVYGEPKIEKSPRLTFYKVMLGFDVYKVTINDLAYVVYDKNNKLYYNFERTGGKNEDIDHDLEVNIQIFILRISS